MSRYKSCVAGSPRTVSFGKGYPVQKGKTWWGQERHWIEYNRHSFSYRWFLPILYNLYQPRGLFLHESLLISLSLSLYGFFLYLYNFYQPPRVSYLWLHSTATGMNLWLLWILTISSMIGTIRFLCLWSTSKLIVKVSWILSSGLAVCLELDSDSVMRSFQNSLV